MKSGELGKLAAALAANRALGIVQDIPLDGLGDAAEARAVQRAALEAFCSDLDGYALVGANPACRRNLGLERPIFGPIADSAHGPDRGLFPLPKGILGAQCELVFRLGRVFPADGEAIDRAAAADAIVAVQPAIGLLGRRTIHPPRNDLGALADFALHVFTLCGPHAAAPDLAALGRVPVVARIDGQEVARATAAATLGHPLDAVAWLAGELAAQGERLNAGDLVATGACTPILQVLPGQHLEADFGPLGQARAGFL
ncbi:MAG: fumarylacetoacetate hydrolase family protein [Rhizobiales bacterium]|nr:fumarylacetoacetate hydrolase family protein [Hyphomicrobiales bacterium]